MFLVLIQDSHLELQCVHELFEGEKTSESDEFKEKIYTIIKKYTKEGRGISFEELKNSIELSEEDFKNYITDLEMESKIYQSEEGIYALMARR